MQVIWGLKNIPDVHLFSSKNFHTGFSSIKGRVLINLHYKETLHPAFCILHSTLEESIRGRMRRQEFMTGWKKWNLILEKEGMVF